MSKQLKDYLHLYLGCECRITGYSELRHILMVNETGLSVCTGTDINGVHIWWKSKDCKLLLRPLSDMTEDEGFALSDIMGFFTPDNFISAIKSGSKYVMDFRLSFELTQYLLKQGFDLFGLIESGLAIDKTKTQ